MSPAHPPRPTPSGEVPVRRVLAGLGAIALAVLLAVVAVAALLRHWGPGLRFDPARLPYALEIPGPRLQSAPQAQRRQEERAQRLRDSETGRLSIDDAMQRLAQPAMGKAP